VTNHLEDEIDMTYYDKMCDELKSDICNVVSEEEESQIYGELYAKYCGNVADIFINEDDDMFLPF
jgi:hypothetical protein